MKKLPILLILLLIAVPLSAINWMRGVDARSGLRENFVCDIISDRQGYIYIATKLGIEKFDGNVVTHLKTDYPALFHPERITFDRGGNLWAVWKDSLWLYDGTGFINDPTRMKARAGQAGFLLPKTVVSDIATRNGRLAYITPDGSLYYTDNTARPAKRYPGLAGGYRRLSLGQDSKVWLFDGMIDGLAYVDFAGGTPRRVALPQFERLLVKDAECTPGGRILVGTNNDGIYVLDHQGNLIEHLTHDVNDRNSIPSDHISSLMVKDGYIYAGTTKKGMHIAGIHPLDVKRVNTGIDADISFFTQNRAGDLLIGFDGAGLALYRQAGDTNPLRHYTTSDSQLPSDVVIGTGSGPGPKLYSTYGGGIFTIDDNGGIQTVDDSDSVRFCRHIITLPDKRIIAATFDNSLAVPGRRMFTYQNSALKTNSITCLAMLGKLVLVGTATGLYVLDPATMSLSAVKNPKLEEMLVLDIHVDSHGFVWIGSSDGLTVLNHRLEPVATINRRNHLSANFVKAICSDHKGDIWVTTVNGINRIEAKVGSDGKLSVSCTPYFGADGIGDIDFDRHSIACIADGRILAGGQGRYLIIDPASATRKTFQRKVYINRLMVDGKDVAPNKEIRGGRIPLSQIPDSLTHITLDYYHSFGIGLTTLRPEGDSDNVFEYRIDDAATWNVVEGNLLTVGALPSGSHTIELREAGSDNITQLTVEIVPPLWQRSWAYILYALILVGGIAVTVILIRRHYRRKLYKSRIEMALSQTHDEGDAQSADELFLAKATSMVKTHMSDEGFSVEQLASLMSMSRSNLYKKINKATGRTPVEYIRMLRLLEAKNLLESGETSISQIAYTVGMSPKFLSKSFKEEYGVSPSKYIDAKSGNQ